MARANQAVTAVVARTTNDEYPRVGMRGEVMVDGAGNRLPRKFHQLLQREGTAQGVHEFDVDVLRLALAEVARGHVAGRAAADDAADDASDAVADSVVVG